MRLSGLAENDRRRRLTFYAIVAAAIVTLIMVAFASRQLWRRVGGPIAELGAGRRARHPRPPVRPHPPEPRGRARARRPDGRLQPDAGRGAPGARRGRRRRPPRGGPEDRARAVGDGSERAAARASARRARPAPGGPLPPGRARPAGGRRLLRRHGAPGRPPGGDGRRHGRPRRPGGRPGGGPALRVAHAGGGQPQPRRGDGRPQRADGPPRPAGRGPVRLDHLHAHRLQRRGQLRAGGPSAAAHPDGRRLPADRAPAQRTRCWASSTRPTGR